MCDMDCDSSEGLDVGTDSDVSTSDAFDEESSFDALEDIDNWCEEGLEDNTACLEADEIFEEDYPALSEYDDLINETDDVSELLELRDSLVNGEFTDIDESSMHLDALEPEYMEAGADHLTTLEEVSPDLVFTQTEVQEILAENEDNPEFGDKMYELIESGRVAIMDEADIENNDEGKVLTRDITPEVIESRERDIEEVLDNYRENLRERGIDEETIEQFIAQERDGIAIEYENLDEGNITDDVYSMPMDWDYVANSLNEDEELRGGEVVEEPCEMESDITDAIHEEEIEERDLSFLLETEEEKHENNAGRFITYYTEDAEDMESLTEYTIDMPEMVEEETQILSDDVTLEEGIRGDEFGEEIEGIESTIEVSESGIWSAGLENKPESVSEVDINYDEIYEEIEQEALEQGYKDINIDKNPEMLHHVLDQFDEDTWGGLEIYEQREVMNELSDYIKDIIGFDNPPMIEYYQSSKPGEYGGYDSRTNTLHINENMLYDSREAADTIAHELWHAHQQECANNPQGARDYQYQYNFNNYIRPEYGFEQYQEQLIEAEARSFAAQFKGRIGNQKGGLI